jgi:hypothetical protein
LESYIWKPPLLLLRKDFGKRDGGHFTDIHIIREVSNCPDIIIHSGTLPSTPATTCYAAPSTIASYASWGKEIMMLMSQTISLHTEKVVLDGLGFITLVRHGQNGSLQRRSDVHGTLCEPQAKITQQKEPPTERMRRMYSCAVDLEVEDKTGRRERLRVVDSTCHALSHDECPRRPFLPVQLYVCPSYPILSYPILSYSL